MPVKKIIGCTSILLVATTVGAVDYTVSPTLPNTIIGPYGFSQAITVGNPFILPNGDTLTVDKASLGAGLVLGNGNYLIGLSGNNTVTVQNGNNITANFGVGTAGYIFRPTGNGSSKIVVEQGGALATTGGLTANHSLYQANSSVQSITVYSLGSITSNIAADQLNSPTNVVALGGSVAPTVTGTLNTGTITGNTYLYIGGYVDASNVDQLQPTTFTYNNPSTLNPFFYVRVMKGSTFNLQANIPVATALAYDTWVIDAGASFNLQASTATDNESLTTNNFRNYGTTNIVSGAHAKILTVNNLLNQGVLNIQGINTKVNGIGTNPSLHNSSIGLMIIGSAGGQAIVQDFVLLTNDGILTVDGTIKNVTTIKNTTGSTITFSNGSVYDTITTIDNAATATINFNNATSTNNANLTLNNNGKVNLQAGDFGALQITNNGLINLSGGEIGATALTAVNDIENNQKGQITGTAGKIGLAAQNYVNDFRNYGQVNLTGVPVVVTRLTNYGNFSLASSSLTVTTFTNDINAKLTLSSATTVDLGAAITNYGTINLYGVTAFNSAITNEGVINISNAVTVQNITNNKDLNIAKSSTYNGAGTTLNNNKNLTVDGATITLIALNNAQGANTTFSYSGINNVVNANINNSGTISLAGNFNHTGNYVGDADSTLIVTGTTNYNGNNPLVQQGIFKATIVDDTKFGKLISNQNVSLANCTLDLDINHALVGRHTFNILQTTGAATITAAPNNFENVNKFLYQLEVDVNPQTIDVIYSREDLQNLELTENSYILVKEIEKIYKSRTNDDVDEFMGALLNYVEESKDVEDIMQQIAPVSIAPAQTLTIQRNFDHLLSERMLTTVVAYNSGTYTNGFSTWMRWIHSKHKQKTFNDIIGYRFSTKGLVLGAEARADNGSYLGMSLALTRSSTRKLNNSASATTKTWQISAYSQTYWTQNFFSNCVFGITNNDISQVKTVSFGPYSRQAQSNYDWQNFFVKTELGYVFNILNTYRFVPKASVKGVYLKGYYYQDYGGGGAVNFINSASPVYTLDVGLGVSLVADLLLFNQPFQPQISASMTYNVLQTPYVITSSFTNSLPFTNKVNVSRFGSQVGAGIKYIIAEEIELDVSYNYDYYQSFTGRTWQIQAKYNF